MNDSEPNKETRKKSPLILFGTLALLVAAGASGVLAATKLGYIPSLPGCGAGSSCDAVTNGPWGTIPVVGWPVSFLGFAWFAGLLFGWITSAGNSRGLLWLIRLGVIASVGFVVLMGGLGSFCKWCLLTHACNIVFWVISELVSREGVDRANSVPITKPFAGAFSFTTVVLAIALQFVPTLGKVVEESTLPLLEARHRIGPVDAPIQIVMFTDYQCPDCFRYEKQLSALVEANTDIAISVKHFPLNYDCNDNIGTLKMHGNACWSARAAEAASILGGEDGWEKMHEWLFTQKGSFTDESLPRSLSELGFNPREFIRVMSSEETLQRVKQDADDGYDLGVFFTPMIFINGVEWLWYYGSGQGSLASAITSVRESGSSIVSDPPLATDKLVEDWRRGKIHTLQSTGERSWLGGGDIDFVVWGDYQADATGRLDGEIKKLLGVDSRIRYSYRHFPIDEACNTTVSNTINKYDGSCFLSKLVESVGVLTNDGARWALHDWMFQQQTPIRLSSALATASSISGVDQSVLQDAVEGIEITSRMGVDVVLKNRIWRRNIPVLVIDGRFVPRWGGEGVDTQDLFQRILGVVESERSSGGIGASR